ncbi:MAG: extracellular solute-binding protein [Candidatus Pacebacteria bacterium]|nr:extracellular solute-binding protein [Candidatus Paceibacterota bacterium]
MKIKIISILVLLSVILVSGFGCKRLDKNTQAAVKPVTLEYWRVFDGPDDFADIIAKYKARHPHITIKYKKFRYDEYEDAILNALAEDRGPDILSIHNSWVRKYQSKLTPMPAETSMAYIVVKGSIKKEQVPEIRTNKSMTLKQIKDSFVDVVYDDVVVDGKVYALPLSVDTLALYYNRDLFNNAGITEIPQYWNRDFQQNVKKLTRHDNRFGIIQSGVALGGGENVERSIDILSALIMQNGGTMQSSSGQILFNTVPEAYKNNNYNPGLEALRFYTDFANPAKEVYCWSDELNNSLEMFISGNLAMMFSYSYNLPVIRSRAPQLDFSVTSFPQIEGNSFNVNFANYWVEAVSSKSKNKNEAWDFVKFMTEKSQAQTYLDKTKKPTALKSLIDYQKEKYAELGVFTDQVLTARSWYKGKNPLAMESIMVEMIENVNSGKLDIQSAINLAASKVQQTVK